MESSCNARDRSTGRRLGSRKVRTGCITCKIRRVKCDEGRPWCNRCTSTGRKCDGYTQDEPVRVARSSRPPEGARSPQPVSRALSTAAPLSPVDGEDARRAFQYFCNVGAFRVAVHAGADFWCRLVLQRAQREPAVRHAVVALGFLLLRTDDVASSATTTPRDAEQRGAPTDPDADDPRLKCALEHYTKAIQSTVSAMGGGRRDLMLAGVTCVLFFCIEALQGRDKEAVRIFWGARRALLPGPGEASGRLLDSATIVEIEAQVGQMSTQCGMMGQPPEADETPRLSSPEMYMPVPVQWEASSPFPSLEKAQCELSRLQVVVLHHVLLTWTPGVAPDELDRQRTRWATALYSWRRRFDALKTALCSGETAGPVDRMTMSLLMQHYLIARLWLAGNLDHSEIVYDRYLPLFRSLVEEAQSWLGLMRSTGRKISFAFEMGLIPPLYWTVLKCRQPALRRQALSLLRLAPAQEGLWKRDLCVRVATRVMQLEEETAGGRMQEFEDPSGHSMRGEACLRAPPEEARIKDVRIRMATMSQERQGHLVEFHWLPNGLNGAWHVQEEFFGV